MNSLNGHSEFVKVVTENYSEMEHQLHEQHTKNVELSIENHSLAAEVRMLRDALERSDADRARLTAVAHTLSGSLMAINEAIGGAMRMAARNGIEAEAVAADPQPAPQEPVATGGPIEPPISVGTGEPPQVDWSRIPRGTTE